MTTRATDRHGTRGHRRLPLLPPIAAGVYVAALLAFEQFDGGVRSHHLLARPDLPEISNWLGLVTLPLLGLAFAWRARGHASSRRRAGIPDAMLAAFLAALVYGGGMAASYALGFGAVTSAAFIGLFVAAVLLPVYRIEVMAGFVAGMAVTFGGVLPLLVASVVACISYVVRSGARLAMRVLHARGARADGVRAVERHPTRIRD